MDAWKGSVAVVTGAAGGIGAALSRALARRGVTVVMTDIDAGRLAEAASGVPGAEHERMDVRNAAEVRALIDDTHSRYGRLDYLFNNAGVGVGGEIRYLTADHWDRAIDVNIRGVLNGIAAAYPIMIRQGHGHIVNTASMAGLGPLPLVVPYATTKHAIVGLTRGLRMEAAPYGVRVSALCPTAVDTPMLDATNPADLPSLEGAWRPDLRRYFHRLVGAPYPPDRLAEDTLRAVQRNEGMIVVPFSGRLRWWGARSTPSIAEIVVRRAFNAERNAAARGERRRVSTATSAATLRSAEAEPPAAQEPDSTAAGTTTADGSDEATA